MHDEVDPRHAQDGRTERLTSRPLMVAGFVVVLLVVLAIFLIIGTSTR